MKKNKNRYIPELKLLISIFLLSIVSVIPAHAIDNKLAGITLGSLVKDLQQKYPDIYKNKLYGGVVLYEACNQKELEVFSFTEEPWSAGYITNIWVRKTEVSTCRDSTGGLPDYSILPITEKGIRLGDTEEKVLQAYGAPSKTKTLRNGNKLITYKSQEKNQATQVVNLALHLEIEKGNVISFHLFGDMAWAEKPTR